MGTTTQCGHQPEPNNNSNIIQAVSRIQIASEHLETCAERIHETYQRVIVQREFGSQDKDDSCSIDKCSELATIINAVADKMERTVMYLDYSVDNSDI